MLHMIPSPLLPLLYKFLGNFALFSVFAGGFVAVDIDFRNQITLGSAIVVILLVIIAGVFTIRSKIATIWREEAEGERAAKERIQEELNQEKISRVEFEKEQQEIRHDLKNKIAEQAAQLKVLEAKTDLTTALEVLAGISARQDAGHDETHRLLEEIRDKLPSIPIPTKIVEDKQ